MTDEDKSIIDDSNIEKVLGTDYTSNSHKSKGEEKPPPEKRVEKVIKGEVKTKKRGIGVKFKEMLFAADFHTVGNYVVADVVLPMIRDLIYESTAKGAEKAIYGLTGRKPPRTGTGPAFPYPGRVQYNNVTPINVNSHQVGAHLPDQRRTFSPTSRTMSDSVIFSSRADAEHVLENMMNVIDQYDAVSLVEFKELCGMETSHMDLKYGWNTLRNIAIRQTREGWVIDLPPLEHID